MNWFLYLKNVKTNTKHRIRFRMLHKSYFINHSPPTAVYKNCFLHLYFASFNWDTTYSLFFLLNQTINNEKSSIEVCRLHLREPVFKLQGDKFLCPGLDEDLSKMEHKYPLPNESLFGSAHESWQNMSKIVDVYCGTCRLTLEFLYHGKKWIHPTTTIEDNTLELC